MNGMTITDLDGKNIEVTDLEKAIEQAALFRTYHHLNATKEQYRSDTERKRYWNDIYKKLLQLQTEQVIK